MKFYYFKNTIVDLVDQQKLKSKKNSQPQKDQKISI